MISTVSRAQASPTQTVATLISLLPANALELRAATLHRAFFLLRSLYGDLLPGLAALEFAQRPGVTPISPDLDQILQILAGSTSSPVHLAHYHRLHAPLFLTPDDVLVAAAHSLQSFLDSPR
jgi:hypothetical protein